MLNKISDIPSPFCGSCKECILDLCSLLTAFGYSLDMLNIYKYLDTFMEKMVQ